MFDAIIQASLRHRLFVLAAAAALMVYGVLVIARMPVDVFPDLNRPTVTIITEAPGMAPEEVEALVTAKIETAINGVPGVTRVRSNSGITLSIVMVEFEWGTDIYLNRQLVAERLATARETMRPGISPIIGPVTSLMGDIMFVGLRSDTGATSPMELRSLADWVLRPTLLSIPGVAQIIPIGGEVKQLQVKVSPGRMQALNVSFEDLEKALEGFATNSTGGFLEQSSQEYLIRNMGQTTRLEDLSNTVVAFRDGAAVRVGQVAEIAVGAGPKRGDAGVDGGPGVIMSVLKQPGANTVQLTYEVERVLAEIQKSLPTDVRADKILFRQANFIERAIANVEEALRDGAILVTIVLFAFLMNMRTTFISLTAIPLSIVVTALVFDHLGLSINTMTLGGLAVAIGELVDDAVVGVENVFRRLKENKERPNPI